MERRQLITNRDLFIARSLALGDSVGELAHYMGVRPQTLRQYISGLYRITGVGTHAGLAGWAVANGVVSIGELQQVFSRGEVDREREC